MKEDCSKLIATSNDLCDENQKVLVLNDEKHIVINSKKRVRIINHSLMKREKKPTVQTKPVL